ncbi:MAG TPA: hypothetical protein VMV82_04490 [Candidatus Dormibacteraeota bacterium]|nr:hypothetical protein [Candidatus Dormibacteraeota bacterium]
MRLSARILSLAAALALLANVAFALPAMAQYANGSNGEPTYKTWQPAWNAGRYDRMHVILGTVAGFTPYRLTVALRNGGTQMVDLKNGTAIFPTGQTPATGEHVALIGYYSKGTFIANRVILRSF